MRVIFLNGPSAAFARWLMRRRRPGGGGAGRRGAVSGPFVLGSFKSSLIQTFFYCWVEEKATDRGYLLCGGRGQLEPPLVCRDVGRSQFGPATDDVFEDRR